MIELDGSRGEGGGQIVRSALALSLATGKPFRIENIRAGRKKPGLMRQHLTAVQAAARVGAATVEGARLGSRRIEFHPGPCRAGQYHFDVGSAGSATLVLQTILPALVLAGGNSELTLEGGTHNAWAPPYDFLEKTFLPLVSRMGPKVELRLARHGFYPAGGGRFQAWIYPAPLQGLELVERGEVISQRARVLSSKLPAHVAQREAHRLASRLGWKRETIGIQEIEDSPGPGNVVLVEIECQNVTGVFCGFGKRGLPAEKVADEAALQAKEYLKAKVPVGSCLADQLLIPMALSGHGKFRTLKLTRHFTTNLDVISQFVDLKVDTNRLESNVVEVEISVNT